MNDIRRVGVIAALCLWTVACRNPDGGSSASASSERAASASSSAPSVSAHASASVAAPPAKLSLSAAYETHLGEVHVQGEAPPFVHPAGETRALGKGTVSLELPAADGVVTGHAEGAMGAQTFSGLVEDGLLSGNLYPVDPKAPEAMWGVLYGPVEGQGPSRSVHATLRASSADGRVVREADVNLAKTP